MSKTTGIATWPQEERPRERLMTKGAQALTDAELLAILIRIGVTGLNAVEFARQLLKQFGSLRAIMEAPALALLEVKGLKGAKAAQLIAAMEIARRISVPGARGQLVLNSTSAAAAYLSERLRCLPEEQFRVLYLNRRNALLEDALIAQGSVDSVRPSLRNIVSRALQVNASGLIAAHNHPTGAAEPSEADRILTQDLITACRPLGLRLLDHTIVGENTTFSFADNGLLAELELLSLAPGQAARHTRLTTTAK